MPRIMGVDIPTEKRIDISLQYLYGVGEFRAKQILKETNIKPETRAELIAAAKTVIGITRKEKGCILYDLHESMTDAARFVFVEQWETMEDLMAHGGNEHMKPWRKVVKECMTAPTRQGTPACLILSRIR